LTKPCAVKDCTNTVKSFRNVTKELKTKIDQYFDLQYNYLKVNQDQICFGLILNDILVNDIDYLKFYEEQQYIDLDYNNFSDITTKIIDDG
ncbi:12356_t:CDS:1, partial [Dentiscutata heterogama]